MFNPLLIHALKKCRLEDEVDSVFRSYGYHTYDQKQNYLNIIIGLPAVFVSSQDRSAEQEEKSRNDYIKVRQLFIENRKAG